MRYAVLHCHSCCRHVWVPEHKLGSRGTCPICGHVMALPDWVPSGQLVEGPPIMREEPDRAFAMAAGQS